MISKLRHRDATFGYDHMPPYGDPLLWIADAVAWCSSAGGAWRPGRAEGRAVDPSGLSASPVLATLTHQRLTLPTEASRP